MRSKFSRRSLLAALPAAGLFALPGKVHAAGASSGSILVAAVDAPPSIKNVADYVCDGIADDVELNNALAFGGEVALSEGRFRTRSPLYPPQYASLVGRASATLIMLEDNANCDLIACLGSGLYRNRIKNLQLDGNKANQIAGNGINVSGMFDAQIEDVVIYNTKQSGIFGDGAVKPFEMIKVSKCRVEGSAGHGYDLRNGDLNLLMGNSAVLCGDTGYYLLQCDSSRFIGNDADSSFGDDYALIELTNSQFVANWSYNSNTGGGNAAIETYGYFRQGVIANNFVLAANRTGIRLGTLAGVDIEDLACMGNVVSGTNPSYHGLMIDGLGSLIDSLVKDNILAANANPMSVTANIVRSLIKDNTPVK